jgi:hypothetical protein
MADIINIPVQDGVPGSLTASKITTIVTAYNGLAAEFNALSAQFAGINKAQTQIIATKLSTLNLIADGVPRAVGGWFALRNVDSQFDANNGIFTPTESGTYRIEWKSLITAVSANSPRAKQWLSNGGVEIALDEQMIATYMGAYRQQFGTWFQGQINAAAPVTLINQCWNNGGGSDLKILGDANTMMIIDRIL